MSICIPSVYAVIYKLHPRQNCYLLMGTNKVRDDQTGDGAGVAMLKS